MSKRDGGEWIDLLKLDFGGGKNTYIGRVGERLTGSDNYYNCTSSGDKAPKLINQMSKGKNKTAQEQTPSLPWHFLFPLAASTWTSSTSESARPRAQHLVISEIRSQPRQCWSNQTHLWTNGSLFTAYSQWETAPSVHVYTVDAQDTPAAPVLTLWEFMSPSVSWNKRVQNLWPYHFSTNWRRYPDSVPARRLWIYALEQR